MNREVTFFNAAVNLMGLEGFELSPYRLKADCPSVRRQTRNLRLREPVLPRQNRAYETRLKLLLPATMPEERFELSVTAS